MQIESQPFQMGCFKCNVILEVLESKSHQSICLKDQIDYVYSPLVAWEAVLLLREWFC